MLLEPRIFSRRLFTVNKRVAGDIIRRNPLITKGMSSPDKTVQLPATATSTLTPTSIDTSLRDLVADPGHGDDTGPLKPGQTFGPRYHIIRLLGVGGMGAVYHAWDTELSVSVAIKVIRPEIMANPTTGADVERR